MKIDVFPHIFPKRFFDRMCEVVPPSRYMQKRTRAIPVLTDLDLRFRIMDRYEGYVQVLTLCSPPIEALAGPELLMAGAAYVPRDPGSPPGCMVADADAALRLAHPLRSGSGQVRLLLTEGHVGG